MFPTGAFVVPKIKLWYWAVMNRNAVTREIKRLEIRIAELAERE